MALSHLVLVLSAQVPIKTVLGPDQTVLPNQMISIMHLTKNMHIFFILLQNLLNKIL